MNMAGSFQLWQNLQIFHSPKVPFCWSTYMNSINIGSLKENIHVWIMSVKL